VEGSNVHTAYTIIDRYPRGVDSLTLREEYGKAYQANDIASLSKAMHRLKLHRYIVAYKKRLFTYGRLKQFLEDLQTNAVEDVPDAERVVKGKWATTVFEFIRNRNGDYVAFAEIVDHITKQKDFENVNNVGPQVAVALRKLQYHRRLIEKMKGRGKGLYRLKTEDSKEQPSADIEPSATAH
jgi:nitrogenase subunit NifH